MCRRNDHLLQVTNCCGLVARELIRLGHGTPTENPHVDWVSEEFDADWDYTVALRNGIGLHFGALPRALQQYTADQFNAGKLRFCSAPPRSLKESTLSLRTL